MFKRLLHKIKVQAVSRRQMNNRVLHARNIITNSKMFDAEWYVQQYPDVSGVDPLDHFLRHGADEGRNPCQRFDLNWYVRHNPDVAETGVNPLLHYIEYGIAEGRSIRAVSDTDPVTPPSKKKTKKHKSGKNVPAAAPYPSDYSYRWQARPCHWSSLPDLPHGRQQLGTQEERDTDERAANAVHWATKLTGEASPQSTVTGRIALFNYMRPKAPPPGHAGPNLSVNERSLLLSKAGLGTSAVLDGWFTDCAHLMLRLIDARSGGEKVRAFQFDDTGALECCGEVLLLSGTLPLVKFGLNHELKPLLLTFQDDDDQLVDAILIPFPSLYRGGLHHAEAIQVAPSQSLHAYMEMLAYELYGKPDVQSAFLIGKLCFSPQGANGSEPGFTANNSRVLAGQYGLAVEFDHRNSSEGLKKLDNLLPGGPHASMRAKSRRTLVLPADGFPSLASLSARDCNSRINPGTFCFVKASDRQPLAVICRPLSADVAATGQHPALPLVNAFLSPPASLNATQHDIGLPLMMRFHEPKTWQVDSLIPVSPDTCLPSLSRDADTIVPTILVIIDATASLDQLPLCLASLATQTVTSQLELCLITTTNQLGSVPNKFDNRCRIVERDAGQTTASLRAEIAAASACDYILFLDGLVCLPDPRTLGHLLSIASRPNTGSVSCVLVKEEAIGKEYIPCQAGYVPLLNRANSDAVEFADPNKILEFFPASPYPVEANSSSLLLFPAALNHAVKYVLADERAPNSDIFTPAYRVHAAGFINYCTSLTRAVTASPHADAVAYPPLPFTQDAGIEAMACRVSGIRKLCR